MGQGGPKHKPGQKIYDDLQLDDAENDQTTNPQIPDHVYEQRYVDNNEYIESDPNRGSNSRTIKRRSTAYTNCIRTSNGLA